VKVTIREMDDPADLQAKLRADGVRVVVTDSPAGGTVQKPRGSVMKLGLTVRMPMPALFTSRSLPSRRDHAAPTARATEALVSYVKLDTERAGKPVGDLGGPLPRPACHRDAESSSGERSAIARPRLLVPPVTNADRQPAPGKFRALCAGQIPCSLSCHETSHLVISCRGSGNAGQEPI